MDAFCSYEMGSYFNGAELGLPFCYTLGDFSFSFLSVAVFVVCRRGNNSQLAVGKLRTALKDLPVIVKDIADGLKGWAEQVDSQFPIY